VGRTRLWRDPADRVRRFRRLSYAWAAAGVVVALLTSLVVPAAQGAPSTGVLLPPAESAPATSSSPPCHAPVGGEEGTGFNSLVIGHSFFIPVAQRLDDLAVAAGFPDHQQIEVFSGGASGSPQALWENTAKRAAIQSALDGGDVELFGMTYHPDYPSLDGYRTWVTYALERNPRTVFFLGFPWLTNPQSLESSAYADLWQAANELIAQGIVSSLRAEFGCPNFFVGPYGQTAAELYERFASGSLPDVDTLVRAPGAGRGTAVFRDAFGHGDTIVLDAAALVWLRAIYGVRASAVDAGLAYTTDVAALADDVMDAHPESFDAPHLTVGSTNPADSAPLRLATATLDAGENAVTAAVTDGVFGYFALAGSPGSTRSDPVPSRLVRVRLSTMARAGSTVLDPAGASFLSAVTDGTHAYFGTDTSPGRVVKVRLADLEQVADRTLTSGNDGLVSAVSDGTHAYFGTDTSPGRVVKVRLADLEQVADRTLTSGNDGLVSAVSDGTHAYFGTDTSPGRVVKLRLADLEQVAELVLSSGEDRVPTAVVLDGVGYFGTATSPGRVVKVDLAGLTALGSLTLSAGDDSPTAVVSDGRFGYYATQTDPVRIVKVQLRGAKNDLGMGRVDATDLVAGEGPVLGAVADGAHGYFGTLTSPARVVKVRLAPQSTTSCDFRDEASIAGYAREGACWLRANGITTNNPFRPGDPVTRAEMAAFLWRAAGEPAADGSCGFTDEASIPGYARQAACWLLASGVTDNNPYRPGVVVTRAQMAAFLWRSAGRPAAPVDCDLVDLAEIPDFARDGACWLLRNSVTRNNPYGPAGPVTRAQMAAFIWRLKLLTLD
jgi:hypothetical protein